MNKVTGIPAALKFGPDGNLYVTDEGHLAMVVFDLGVKGYRLPFCPSRSKDHPWSKMLPEIRGSKYNKDRNNANMFME